MLQQRLCLLPLPGAGSFVVLKSQLGDLVCTAVNLGAEEGVWS